MRGKDQGEVILTAVPGAALCELCKDHILELTAQVNVDRGQVARVLLAYGLGAEDHLIIKRSNIRGGVPQPLVVPLWVKKSVDERALKLGLSSSQVASACIAVASEIVLDGILEVKS